MIDEWLKSQGLNEENWSTALCKIEKRLSPTERQEFQKRHRNFVNYLTEKNLVAFYDFIFEHQLQIIINGYRYHRIQQALMLLSKKLPQSFELLDWGAGCGLVARYLQEFYPKSSIQVYDLSSKSRLYLKDEGLKLWDPSEHCKFDYILCLDSLGENNSGLPFPENSDSIDLIKNWMEENYGYLHKSLHLKKNLKPQGEILVSEPFSNASFYQIFIELLKEKWEVRPFTFLNQNWGLRLSAL